MATLLSESYEGSGYENSWNETVGVGNTVDEDKSISGTPPTGSGSQSLECILAGSSADAYTTFDYGSTNNVNYIRVYFYISSAGTVSFSTHNIITLKGAVNNLNVFYRYTPSNGHHISYQYYDNGTQNAGQTNNLSLNTWYRFEAQYDATGMSWEFRLDGSNEASGSIVTSARTDSRYLIIGAVGNKTDGLTIEFDLVKWVDDDWIGEEAGGITVEGTAADTLDISESQSETGTMIATSLDGLDISDSSIKTKLTSVSISDNMVLSDSSNNSIIALVVSSDGIILADTGSEGSTTATGILSGSISAKTGSGSTTSKIGTVLFSGKKSNVTFTGTG